VIEMKRSLVLAMVLAVSPAMAACGDGTTTPSPMAPAVASGSGLEGYTRTTFPAVGGAREWRGVADLAVAPDGMVWAATWEFNRIDGEGYPGDVVARFDGETWTTYTAEAGLPYGLVLDVEVAPDGTVWAAGEGGIARLEGEKWATVSVPRLVRDGLGAAPDLAVAPDGSAVAAGMDTVARFDGETWTTLFGPPTDRNTIPGFIHILDVSPVDGAVWVGTQGGWIWGAPASISRFDGRTWTTWAPIVTKDGQVSIKEVEANELPAESEWVGVVSAVIVAPDGSVWVMLGDWTLARFDGSTWAMFLPPLVRSEGTGWPVEPSPFSMAVGPDGTIWVARGDGLLLSFDGSSWTKDRLGERLSTVEVASDGTLWVGSFADDSLVRLTPPAE
jgi:hypothetical protein